MDASKDYYAILGVLPSAEDFIIKAAYKALCKRFHPDVYNGFDAHERMAAINEAYEVLKDDTQRGEYDRRREEKTTDDGEFFNDDFDIDQHSVDPFEEDWKVAVTYYPEVNAISKRLAKTSARLAFAFRVYMLEEKNYDKAGQIAEVMENAFLTQFFGKKKKIHAFARLLINHGKNDVLLELSRTVKVLGSGISSQKIINQLCSEFKLPNSYNLLQQKREEERQTLLRKVEREAKWAAEREAEREAERKKLDKLKRKQRFYSLMKFSLFIICVSILAACLAYKYYNDEISLFYLKSTAKAGVASSQTNLALKYAKGEGVAQDGKEAVKWYRKAVEQGYAEAQYNLGLMYAKGEGVTQDDKKAFNWYRKAAEQGYAEAQYNLGLIYYNGRGVSPDYIQAYAWYNLAALSGDANAEKSLRKIEVMMTSEQIAKAQELYRTLHKKIKANKKAKD
jgi:TPR repeat protein